MTMLRNGSPVRVLPLQYAEKQLSQRLSNLLDRASAGQVARLPREDPRQKGWRTGRLVGGVGSQREALTDQISLTS